MMMEQRIVWLRILRACVGARNGMMAYGNPDRIVLNCPRVHGQRSFPLELIHNWLLD